MNFDDEDLTDDDEDFEELSEEELRAKVPEFDSDKLCGIIVAHRYLGFYKSLYIPCMEELAKRRIAGDSFDFETNIETSLKDMPKLDFNITDIGSAIEQLKKMSTPK
jgi:hypothetical protein